MPNQLRTGAHTDFGAMTILAMTQAKGGLEVHMPDGSWAGVMAAPDELVVNLGDMIARWTNDRYRSTLHRVINTSGRERYSVPFFFSGNPDFEVACIPTCLEPGEMPKYPPIRVEDHLLAMYRKTYAA